jgi:Tfp pilus assembly protein PilX
MLRNTTRYQNRRQGSALISALAFMVIISLLLAGVGTLCVSHYARAREESDYAGALDLAEAGIDYEFRKISDNVAQADSTALTVNTPFGTSSTSYTVQCVNRGTTTPWSGPGTYLDILSTGTINGTSRQLRVAGKGSTGTANYAVFAIKQGNINGTSKVTGNVGTNGAVNINGTPSITGSVILNGSAASATINPSWLLTPVKQPQAVSWQTVDQLATQQFPSGGLTWLSTHNDNSLASPAIVSNSVTMNGTNTLTLNGKAGGANYYLTTLNLNGTSKIVFNNTAGPITIWFGPDGGTSAININGGTASVKMSSDPTKAVRMYVGENSAVNLNGSTEFDAGVYAYNGTSGGQVNFNGTGNIYGSVIANTIDFNGSPNVNYVSGYFQNGVGYYGYDNSWLEINGVNQ